MNNLISVIIPAYNAEEYIERCILSVRNQTYKNTEIIVVNDGSTDSTPELVKNICRLDHRVKIINIENGGVSHARNIGIDNATGDYITFVDADDTIEPKMYETLLNIILEYSVKIAHCSYNNYLDDKFFNSVGNTKKVFIQDKNEALSCLIEGRLFIGGLCNKLYSISLFNNVRLDKSIKINEDILANVLLFNKVEKSVYIDIAFYNYFSNSKSATHTESDILKSKQSLFVSEQINYIFNSTQLEDIAKMRLAGSYLGYWRSLSSSKNNNPSEVKMVKIKVLSFNNENLYKRKNDKIIILMLRYFPFAYKAFYKIYDKIRVKKLDPEQ